MTCNKQPCLETQLGREVRVQGMGIKEGVEGCVGPKICQGIYDNCTNVKSIPSNLTYPQDQDASLSRLRRVASPRPHIQITGLHKPALCAAINEIEERRSKSPPTSSLRAINANGVPWMFPRAGRYRREASTQTTSRSALVRYTRGLCDGSDTADGDTRFFGS